MRRWLKRLLLVLVVAAAACLGGWVWYSTRDYAALFRQRKGQLLTVETQPVSATARTTVADVRLRSDTGLLAAARVRAPRAAGRYPGVALVAGLETGQRVIDLVEEYDDLVLMAVDYGWDEAFDISSLSKVLPTIGKMRRTSDRAVPHLLLGLDYLARHPQVEAGRLAVVGVSYGSYFALPAAALDERISQTIILQGGGSIGPTVAANADFWRAPLPPRVFGWLGATVFLPFQPERWVDKVAPRPVTFIASRTDPRLPVASVEEVLARAAGPKRLVWHDTPHVAPDAAEIIAELSRVVLRELGRDGSL